MLRFTAVRRAAALHFTSATRIGARSLCLQPVPKVSSSQTRLFCSIKTGQDASAISDGIDVSDDEDSEDHQGEDGEVSEGDNKGDEEQENGSDLSDGSDYESDSDVSDSSENVKHLSPGDYHAILQENEHFDEFGRIYSTGKRKTSVARVWIQEGSGQFIINGKRISEYFQVHPREHALAPLMATRSAGFFDVWCTVKGGGTLGQAGAVRLGIAKAMSLWDRSMRTELKNFGDDNLLYRDPRNVERKKPGQKKARKKYQWVKR